MNSTGATRPDGPVFYLDESIQSRVLVERLRSLDVAIQCAGEAFPFGTRDDVWLKACGGGGWIVLMRDKRIRYRTLERATLMQAKVGAFVLTAGQATASETAETVERHLPGFARIAANESRPFLYAFGLRGRLTKIRLGRQ